ncbi:hypothetical protein [Actinomadura latina]|uniref:Uncharacterized protein n=1 Tax=Actinomadura latina TaxID=163603 RepID=A0A846YTR1_9ACTN|nr:hypothetical protein [Actinomadura latina]NKZ03127.1 hypothetical protein [Actinomadura latina]
MTCLSDAELDALVEHASVDAYDEPEQRAAFHCLLEEHLTVPFQTTVLGVEVTVTEIDVSLPTPRPAGAEWIDAYRHWAR